MKFNQRIVDGLELPSGKSAVIYWDDAVPGLGVRLQGTARRWIVRYRVIGDPKQKQVTLGALASLPLRKARELAGGYIAAAKQGTDQNAAFKAEAAEAQRVQQSRAEGRLGALVESYLAHAEQDLRPSTMRELRRYLRIHWKPLHTEIADEMDKRDLVARMEAIALDSGPVAANRARSYLSMALAWGVKRGILESNVVMGIAPLNTERSRDRVLSDAELLAIWQATEDSGDYNAIVRILLLTGQRRDEVAGIRWSEIDLGRRVWEIPSDRTKNRRPHQIPMSDQVTTIIEALPRSEGRDLVFGRGIGAFSGFGQCKRRLDDRSGVKEWRLHDLRRTGVTGMAELGIPVSVIESVVNHVSGQRAGVAGVYDRSTLMPQRREALQRWADHISRLVGEGTQAEVVPLRPGA